jgi:hypothetical protein
VKILKLKKRGLPNVLIDSRMSSNCFATAAGHLNDECQVSASYYPYGDDQSGHRIEFDDPDDFENFVKAMRHQIVNSEIAKRWAQVRGKVLVFALALCLAVVGCSAVPTLDATNMKTVSASTAQMTKDLPAGEREQFKRALVLKTFRAAMKKKGDPATELKDWHGLTARQIIAKSKQQVTKS